MSRKKVFKTAEEAVEYLFSEELESEMIVLPPEVNEFTDEEGFDDSETFDPSVAAVTVKPPPFWTDIPGLWFAHVETQFHTNKITVEETKYFTIVGALEQSS
ncbi:hypothetical protein NPIL_115721 [Nephila pilipes]|uniref:DUF7041 domain-containing protein n=1 Tax=Nephila pilipes TaxID=299642 RepID=A0A8X6ULQ5_NEPPI|nr:hypothetical protein NPIL_115721 [Nephila pilipes]